LGGGV
jgi:hypothetical protein